jgi:hypothetical protein
MPTGDDVSKESALVPGGASPPLRYLVIVARDRPDLYEQLTRQFANDANVRVMFDRRLTEDDAAAEDPRRANRRHANMQVLAKLWLAGYAVVRVE